MKIVIAIDSFKGSMSSMEAGNAAKAGILRACGEEAVIAVKPLADGGEGTTEALVEGLGGEYVSVRVTGPLGEKTNARYGILGDGRTAVMEMAEASGIILVKREELEYDDRRRGRDDSGCRKERLPGIHDRNRRKRHKRRRNRHASGAGL